MNLSVVIVSLLLETSPYDIDDPLDRHDPAFYPPGFRAKNAAGDERLFALSPRDSTAKAAVYAMSVFWTDEYTGQRRALKTISYDRVKPENAKAWLETTASEWAANGFEITWL